MTRLAIALAAVCTALVLTLGGVGAISQLRFDRQAALLEQKEAALIELAARRAEAAIVNGPLAVTTWARAAGMVPAPDAGDVVAVAPGPAPDEPAPGPTAALEVRTVWR